MRAVILAAGEGRRLRPFTETMPKVMLPIANKPILEYVFDAIKKTGINEIVVVVGYKKECIMEYFKDYEGLKISYVFQDKQLGTAHALLQAKDHIKETFLVLSGDNIIDDESLSDIIQDRSESSMLIKEYPQFAKYGIVYIEKGMLKSIIKQPIETKGGLISTGIYKFPKSFFDKLQEFTSQGNYSLLSVIQSFVDDGNKIKTLTAQSWMDIVYPWDLLRVNEFMIKKISSSKGGIIEQGAIIKGQVFVGKNTTIHSGSYVVGPVIIGENCEIGPHACIFPSTSIGNNSVIRPFCEIRNSVIMNDIHLGSSSFVTNSIIGKGNTIHNNFTCISGSSVVEIEGEFIRLDAIGAMVGEDCIIGSNVVVEPGKILGRNCEIDSLKNIKNNIPSKTKVM